MKQFVVVFLALAACGVAVAQPSFGFTEGDYRGLESTGVLQAIVRRSGNQNGIIVVNVRTVTKNQYLDMGFSLDNFPNLDPAELGDPLWNDDFTLTDVNITFPDNSFDRVTVDIPIVNDEVHEASEEGFIILMDVVESSEVVLVTRNVTVGLIQDDDDLIVTFELSSLTVSEAQGSLDVYVEKQGGMVSELTVDVNIDAFQHNTTYDDDFILRLGRPHTIVFSPFDQRLPVGAIIIEDDEIEGLEHYSVDLITSTDNSYVLGDNPRVLVFIEDNDAPDPTGTTTPMVDCPDHDVAIGITFLITFLLTFLLTCLLAFVIAALVIAWDRKKRAKAVGFGQLEQQTQQQQQTSQH